MTSSSCTRGGPGSSQLPHITQLLQQKLPIQVHWFVCFCVCYDISAIRHVIMGPSFLEGGFILCWSCPSVCLSVCLSVPCLHLEGKQKGLRIPNLVGRVPGTQAPRGPISRSKDQRSRSQRLIAQFAKNPHNFAGWLISFRFGRCHKDPSPPCTGWPRYHSNGRSLRLKA